MHVFIPTVDLPQIFCVFKFFCGRVELLVFIGQNLIGLDMFKDQTKVSVRINEVIYSNYCVHLLFTELERNCDFLYLNCAVM